MEAYRQLVIDALKKNKKPGEVFRGLKHLGVKRDFVYRTIKRYHETGSTADRKRSGRPRTVRIPEVVKVVRERVRRNCCRSARKMAQQCNIKRESMRLLLKKDLNMKPFKKRRVHGISEKIAAKRYQRSLSLLKRHGKKNVIDIIFSDEKLFTLQQNFNSQNDRIWSVNIQNIPNAKRNVPKFQSAASVMVWGAVSSRGKFPLIFVEKGVKITAKYYLETVLKENVLPQAQKMYGEEYYCFQQDGAPSHTANLVQAWCKQNLCDFIPKDEWPPSSPDLNPLDYFVWSYMLLKLQDVKTKNLADFKKNIAKVWDEIPDDMVRAACSRFKNLLKLVRKEKGGVIPREMLN